MPEAIDAHAHVFLRDLPMISTRRYTPARDAPVDLYLQRLDENGMTHGVLVQPSFLGTDNSYLIRAIARAPSRLRGVAVLDADTPAEEFDRLDSAGVVGARLNLVGGAPLPDFDAPHWRAFVANVRRKGWQIEIQRPARDAKALVARLIAAGCTVVIDHFGLPDPVQADEDPDWRALLDAGRTRRLWAKVSGPYRSGPQGRDIARKCFPVLRDALGPDRLMWGSDWPHTQFEAAENYAGNRRFLDALIPAEKERAALLAAPARLFRF
ncbi:MAG: amidohydrolase family protein [Hyphomicrobiales bacterium]|nr:amidohydrolase family protein [Hyphomicrobiales bacterium]